MGHGITQHATRLFNPKTLFLEMEKEGLEICGIEDWERGGGGGEGELVV